MALEIERKFLLPVYPADLIERGELTITSIRHIDQTYLAIEEDSGQELRVRKLTDEVTGVAHFTHTFKNGVGISREEVEYEISEGLYLQLIDALNALPLTKKRVTGIWDGYTVEMDIYDQFDIAVVEVEFATYEEAISFTPPSWFGEDASESRQYRNKVMWEELQQRKPAQN